MRFPAVPLCRSRGWALYQIMEEPFCYSAFWVCQTSDPLQREHLQLIIKDTNIGDYFLYLTGYLLQLFANVKLFLIIRWKPVGSKTSQDLYERRKKCLYLHSTEDRKSHRFRIGRDGHFWVVHFSNQKIFNQNGKINGFGVQESLSDRFSKCNFWTAFVSNSCTQHG